MKLPIALSNRHLHLSKEDIEALFGKDYSLTKSKDLSQPGQYACEEKVDIEGPKGIIKGVRVLGPARKRTQIEISFADSRTLGLKAPVRDSGDIDGSPGAKLIGPKGEVEIVKGIIIASRHIHMSPEDANDFGVKDMETVQIETTGERAVVFKNVLVRVHPNFSLEMHVDLEEGNAAGLSNGDKVELLKEV